jgi:hypothetical protein
MLRASGFNVPLEDDEALTSEFDHLSERAVEFNPMSDRDVIEAHGYDVNATPVDVLMRSNAGYDMAYHMEAAF